MKLSKFAVKEIKPSHHLYFLYSLPTHSTSSLLSFLPSNPSFCPTCALAIVRVFNTIYHKAMKFIFIFHSPHVWIYSFYIYIWTLIYNRWKINYSVMYKKHVSNTPKFLFHVWYCFCVTYVCMLWLCTHLVPLIGQFCNCLWQNFNVCSKYKRYFSSIIVNSQYNLGLHVHTRAHMR